MPHFKFNPNDLHRLNRLRFIAGTSGLEQESGTHRTRRAGEGADFLDYRPYTAGDDVRKVDWSVYGRTRQLFVRLDEAPRQLAVTLLVDVSQSMLFGKPLTKLEQAMRIACALGFVAMRNGDRVYGSCFSDSLGPAIGPLTGARALPTLIGYFQNLKSGGHSDLFKATTKLRASGRCRGLVIVLSDFLGAGSYEEPLSMLLGGGARVAAVQVLDDLDLGHGLEGHVRVRDSETAAMVDVYIDERVRAAYRAKFELCRRGLEDFCIRRRQIYMLANTRSSHLEIACNMLRAQAVVR